MNSFITYLENMDILFPLGIARAIMNHPLCMNYYYDQVTSLEIGTADDGRLGDFFLKTKHPDGPQYSQEISISAYDPSGKDNVKVDVGSGIICGVIGRAGGSGETMPGFRIR